MIIPEEPFHIRLHELLDLRLNEDELKDVCYYLQVDYNNLPAQTKRGKLRELIEWSRRRNQLEVLCYYVGKLRPDLEPDIRGLGQQIKGALPYLDIATAELRPRAGIEHVLRDPERMYIHLECTNTPGGAGMEAVGYIEGELAKQKALLIVGDYGTGKSFLVQRLFLRQARTYCEHGGRIPVLLPLKELDGVDDDRALIKIGERLRLLHFFDRADLTPTEERNQVKQMLQEGKLLCILDGFDEIPRLNVRLYPLEALQKLLSCLIVGDNRVIITTRPGIIPVVLTADFARQVPDIGTVYLLPWQPKRHWPEYWYRYLGECRKLGVTFGPADETFVEEVLARPNLCQLTVTPLYCQMLVETRQTVMQTADLNVTTLYSIYTERYFTNVRGRSLLQGLFKKEADEIPYKHNCLAATAIGMIKKNILRLTEEEIEQSLWEYIADQYNRHQLKAFALHDTLIYSLLVPDSTSTYSFSHKSFYEYYVARMLLQEFDRIQDPSNLLNQLLIPNEVVVFLAQLLLGKNLFANMLATRPILLRNLVLLQLESSGKLEDVKLEKLNFKGYQFVANGQPVSLRRVDLNGSALEGASLTGVDLRGSSLRGVHLERAILDNADLRDVDLTSAFLKGISCTGTRFSGALFDATTLMRRDANTIKIAIADEDERYPGSLDPHWRIQAEHALDRNAV